MKQPPNRSRIVENAQIDWQQSTPISEQFEDVYFSRDCGPDETQHVFIHHNRLEQRWRDDSLSGFTIAETGFGTGLNFLCTADYWQQQKHAGHLPMNAHLHFVSVEKYPLALADMRIASRQWPQLVSVTEPLLEQYPAPVRGVHRLYFAGPNITLTLIFDDAIAGFSGLDGLVDAWFLDGFAPAKNPDMWQPALFEHIGRLSYAPTTVATFTAAGVVKRGLRDAGFKVEKVAGFGRKREMLRGDYLPAPTQQRQLPPGDKPWFHFDYQAQRKATGSVAVIGAGMAGATAANSLARRGWQVTVLEQEPRAASQGSGNPTGITFTKLSLHDTPQNRFYQWAYLYACRYIQSTFLAAGIEPGVDWNLNGLLRLAFDEKEAREQAALLAESYWPPSLLENLSPAQIQERLGIESPIGGLMLHGGGWLHPAAWCDVLLSHPKIELLTSQCITHLTPTAGRWRVNQHGPFDAVILANAFGSARFQQSSHLPLKPVRGQISYLPATAASLEWQHAVNYHGYVNPARAGFHCVGATFDPRSEASTERQEDHQWNCDQLRSTLPALAEALGLPQGGPHQGRVGFRCQTPDYLPIIGPLPDAEAYRQQFDDLGKGFLKREFPFGPCHDGLFITCGHGSRGITSTCFAAEILASYLSGEPQPADREILFAIHPARFLIRNIMRRTSLKTTEFKS